MVADVTARRLATLALPELHRRGLHPVVVWEYDVGSASLFISDTDAHDGAQFDIVNGDGDGRYGVRAGPVLAAAERGVRWPKASPTHELLYRIRKRQLKSERRRLHGALSEAAGLDRSRLEDEAAAIFSPSTARVVVDALRSTVPNSARDVPTALRPITAPELRRRLSRVRTPAGFWVSLPLPSDAAAAAALAQRFGRFLPVTSASPSMTPVAGMVGMLRSVGRTRWRAGLCCTYGPIPSPIRPDLALPPGSTERDAARATVEAMERRLRL